MGTRPLHVALQSLQIKYFDFYYIGWASDEDQDSIRDLVNQITNFASQIIQPYLKQTALAISRCGCEDHACIKDALGPRYNGLNPNPQNWPSLPADQAKQFLRTPSPTPLKKDDHIYRIIGPENNPYGSWWLNSCTLDDRAFWREQFAVKVKWNSNNYYIDFVVEQELKVWIGEAASQQAGENCILPGGYRQIWISPSDTEKFENLKPKIIRWPLDT